MKILLLRPDSDVYTAPPPLGILYLAACFRQKAGWDVSIYDGRIKGASVRQIVDKIAEEKPEVVGISLFAMERAAGHETAHLIKKTFSNLTVIFGGPYPTTQVEDSLQDPSVDFVVCGEGELSGSELLQALQKEHLPDSIPGVAWQKNGTAHIPETRPFIENLDDLPQPAWDLLDLEEYFYGRYKPAAMNLYQKNKRSVPLICSRGCPYRCVYCHKLFGKKLRKHSIAYIIDQIEYLHRERGVEEIEIADDIFNLDLQWAKSFAEAVRRRKISMNFCFPNGLRADQITEEVIDLLVDIGTYRIVYAIETGSPRLQRSIRKNVNLVKAQKYIDYTTRKGISVGAFFILGFLDETEEEMRQTIRFACQLKISTVSFFILTPFPGTEVFQQALDRNLRVDNAEYSHYYAISANLSKVPDNKIMRLRLYAYLRFYLNPFRIIRLIRTTPLPRFFGRTLWTAFQYLVLRSRNATHRPIQPRKTD
jgi:radical SAM superfamily enzyme YgiQ (UPF0313 family)